MEQITREMTSGMVAKVSASVSTPVEIERPVVGQIVKIVAIVLSGSLPVRSIRNSVEAEY
jgi:hypothetical protein